MNRRRIASIAAVLAIILLFPITIAGAVLAAAPDHA